MWLKKILSHFLNKFLFGKTFLNKKKTKSENLIGNKHVSDYKFLHKKTFKLYLKKYSILILIEKC